MTYLVNEPLLLAAVSACVFVDGDDAQAGEGLGSLKDRPRVDLITRSVPRAGARNGTYITHVADHLRVVVALERGADEVGSVWKVDDGRLDSRSATVLATTVLVSQGLVDSLRIVCLAVALSDPESVSERQQQISSWVSTYLGTVVFDVAKYLVVIVLGAAVWHSPKVFDFLHPP